MNDRLELPLKEPLQHTLRKITERLAEELAQPSKSAPDWTANEWRLARAVAVIHCISPLLAGSLTEGPRTFTDFLVSQKAHVAARHRRLSALLAEINAAYGESGIAAMALKGTALHELGLYRAGERPMADVDLLVREADSAGAAELLESLGYHQSFANSRHRVFVPKDLRLHPALGEHADNHLKIELHTRIAEKLPLSITDVTEAIFPPTATAGLNAYPSKGALMLHLLLHAAGAMAYRAMRIVNLHDIALLAGQMGEEDWRQLSHPRDGSERRWWALPPLKLTERYYRNAIPAEVMSALADQCPWTLRRLARRYQISEVSLSYPWIEAFPGIGWSQSLAERARYVGSRIFPGREVRKDRSMHVETDFVAGQTQWYTLSQRQRMLRWLTSRPLRVETLHAVRLALSEAH